MANGTLHRECERAARRARTLRIIDFSYRIDGDTVILEGDALTPEGVDSAGKVFTATNAREVKNLIRHVPPEPAQPGALSSPDGYVHIEELGPDGSRLAETTLWEVCDDDSLASIATAVYGDAQAVDRILNANRFLGPTAHLRPGMRLRIPAP